MVVDVRAPGAASAGAELADDRPSRPIVGWAILGGCFVALFAYLIIRWLTSDAAPTPAGRVPTYTHVAALVYQIAQAVLVPLLLYRIVVRPWRRDGQPTTDGAMCLAFITCWWQDTICNSLAPFTMNTAAFWNLGSWDNYIPLWVTPHGNRVVEPPLGSSGVMYFWAPLGVAVLGCWVMRRVRRAWPSGGLPAQLVACLITIGCATMVGELVALRLGLWDYPGANPGVTLFGGHYYQFPLYEAFFFGLVGTAWACVRQFRNDRGQTVAERGLERLSVSSAKRSAIRVLALAGILNVTFLACWQLPMAHMATVQAAWPRVFSSHQYLSDDLCGAGTAYACPGPSIPINRPRSLFVDRGLRLQFAG